MFYLALISKVSRKYITHIANNHFSCLVTTNFTAFPDAPIITPCQKSIVVQVNRQAMVPCGMKIQSYPTASFTWTKLKNNEGEKETLVDNINQKNGSLLFNTTDYSDAGIYICTAENSIGTTSTKVMVLVLGKTHLHVSHGLKSRMLYLANFVTR